MPGNSPFPEKTPRSQRPRGPGACPGHVPQAEESTGVAGSRISWLTAGARGSQDGLGWGPLVAAPRASWLRAKAWGGPGNSKCPPLWGMEMPLQGAPGEWVLLGGPFPRGWRAGLPAGQAAGFRESPASGSQTRVCVLHPPFPPAGFSPPRSVLPQTRPVPWPPPVAPPASRPCRPGQQPSLKPQHHPFLPPARHSECGVSSISVSPAHGNVASGAGPGQCGSQCPRQPAHSSRLLAQMEAGVVGRKYLLCSQGLGSCFMSC